MTANTPRPFKWDRVVRLSHWLIAALFFANMSVTEEGSGIHRWFGYVILGAIVLRLIWGMLTHSEARLTRFIPSLSAARAHFSNLIRGCDHTSSGHNPAAALMIWSLWGLLLVTILTGWTMTQSGKELEWLEEVHEFAANATLILVTIHVSAAILMSRFGKRNYIKSMLR